MSWRDDPFWLAASQAALAALADAELVLVPAEFLGLDKRFAPLEYSFALPLDERRIAYCCSKDDADRVAPALVGEAASARCVWANEVFVIGANVDVVRDGDGAAAASLAHWGAWVERVARYRSGVPARALRMRRAEPAAASVAGPSAAARHGPRVLVIGASGMGNVGDDLLADVLADMLFAEGAGEVCFSGPDIDPLDVAGFGAVVVGGGGLIYASRDGRDERQNLANYLKFGPIGVSLGVPVGLIGVSEQDHARGIEADPTTLQFARLALASFGAVTTRDAESADLLDRLGAHDVHSGCDLLFAWYEQARHSVRPSAKQPRRVALVGELYDHVAFARGLADGDGPLAEFARDGDFDVLVMSDDDLSHAERTRQALRKTGAAAAVVDLRGRRFDALVYLFASYAALITTRFHGLVFALLCDVPVLALDVPTGKKTRLLQALDASDALLGTDAPPLEAERLLASALEARMPDPAAQGLADRVSQMIRQCAVHRNALRRLLTPPPSTRSMPSTSTSSKLRSGSIHRPPRTADLVSRLTGEVALSWAASAPETSGYGNVGDSLSAVMVAALSGRPIKHVDFDADATKLVAVGSVGHAIRGGEAVVWGAGVSIRGGVLAQNVPQTRYDVRAIRGTISARHYRDFGIDVPNVFGDPVWMLPSIFSEPVEKKYELGVIPHIQDIQSHHPDAPPRPDSERYKIDAADAGPIVIINTWHDASWDGLVAKLKLMLSCKRILSQSFHGVVIAEAYGIPVLNFRHVPTEATGLLKVPLDVDCKTDPRIWEFFQSGQHGRQPHFLMYNQRRNERSDWPAIIDAIDRAWQPFEYDAAPLIEAFPLPLAYDPLRERVPRLDVLRDLRL